MKIYTQDLKTELKEEELDLTLGYLKECEEVTIMPATEEVAEEGHYEVIKTYENGGQDVAWIIDQPYIPKRDEERVVKTYKVYIPFSENHFFNKPIREQLESCQNYLTRTDFQILKYIEGELDEKDFISIRDSRKHCREEIKRLQSQLKPESEEERDR